jgi:flavin reductase (DIM6/NTAB) family NADH-FMN oxidoreductase RutF
VRLEHAARLLNHGPTVLVTSAHGSQRNVMAAAWSMPVNFNPAQIAVVIDASTHTRELIMASGQFALCIPGRALRDLVYALGNTSGRDGDKFQRFGLSSVLSPVLGLPVLETDCSAWLECRVLREPRTEQAYDTLFGEVVGAAAHPAVFAQGRWDFRSDNRDLHTLHHLGGGSFVMAGDVERARPV